jgi:hypothetical protein
MLKGGALRVLKPVTGAHHIGDTSPGWTFVCMRVRKFLDRFTQRYPSSCVQVVNKCLLCANALDLCMHVCMFVACVYL